MNFRSSSEIDSKFGDVARNASFVLFELVLSFWFC